MIGLPEDIRGSDVGLAFAVPSAVLLLALALFGGASRPAPERPASGGEIAVQVMPVMDTGAGGAGGGGPTAAGGASAAPESAPTRSEEPRAKKGQKRRRPAPSPTQAEPSASAEPSPSADSSPSAEAGGGAEPVPGETGDAGSGSGAGEGGDGPGEGGGLAGKAISAYRERLIRWLARRFSVRGSGLSQDQLRRSSARAEVDVSESGVVIGYRILEASHPAFDRAARDALDAILGESLPPPPDFYPGAVPTPLRVTFLCAESTCD